ncbi:MAG: DUF2783 domain-containing protein [Robiginitomaculum sp.]
MSGDKRKLITALNLTNTDDIYERLIDAHDGLSDDDSNKFNAKLILLLFNHIGDEQVINEALCAAEPA